MPLIHGTSMVSTPGQFGPVLLPKVSKNDDKEHCFLQSFGFSWYLHSLKLIVCHIEAKKHSFFLNFDYLYGMFDNLQNRSSP